MSSYNKNEIKKAKFQTSFHGEIWYRCPFCNESFELFDTKFQRGFEKLDDHIYKHKKCGNIIKI